MPVAIIGMACRFPEADAPAQLWRALLCSRVTFQELEAQRWEHREFLGPARDRWGTTSRRAALITDVDRFAARHFEIAPRRAEMMDPQQRLVMELAREALQDAGLENRTLDRQRSAVFVGASVSEYAGLIATRTRLRQVLRGEFGEPGQLSQWPALLGALDPIQPHTMAGCLLNMIASGVAQSQDFRGPAFTLDAACASSLVAVHQAAAYLRSLSPGGPSPVALAGGVYLLLAPENTLAFSRAGVLAESECRPYDHRASGFLLGEGAALVALKRLDLALADGDRIYAVLAGGACNSDGYSQAAAAPNVEGQAAVMRSALEAAGLEPSEVALIEGHGTATATGDRSELTAIGRLWGAARPWLTSSKANFGHSLTAAGMAGLLRAALAIYHGQVPPQVGWEAWPEGLEPPARVPLESVDWSGARRALVNAFGFGGTNSSLVLTQAPPRPPAGGSGPWPVLAGAEDRELLAEYLARLHESLRELSEDHLGRWAWTLACRRPGPCRLGFLVADLAQARRELTRLQGVLLAGAELPDLAQVPDFPPECQQIVDVPLQPLARESFWQVKGRPPGPRGADLQQRWRRSGRLALDPAHPCLEAHRLSDRCLLPLALGLDLLVWRAGLEPPFALEGIRVERPLWVDEPLWVRVEQDGPALSLYQGRRLYLSARVGSPGSPPDPGTASSGPAELTVGQFYAEHTFHGPVLQSLVDVTECSETRVAGRVRGAPPELPAPPVGRRAWSLDPVRLDGAFQLALYWARARRGRSLLPTDVEQLVVLGPWTSPLMEVRGRITGEDERGLQGDALLLDGERLLGWVKGLAGRYRGGPDAS